MLSKNKQNGSVSLKPPVNKSARNSVLISSLFIIGSCVGGVIFWISYDNSIPIVVAAEDISQGEKIELSSLKLIDSRGDFERIESLDDVVGQIAADSIKTGEPVAPSDLSETVEIDANKTIIGVLLKPGGYPSPNIRVGSRVDVFAASSSSSDASLIASNVEVFDVTISESGPKDEILFALVLSQSEATEVTNASKQSDGVRIALRGSL